MFEAAKPSNARLCAFQCGQTEQLEWADALGWVVRDVSSHEMTRLPSSFDLRARVRIGETGLFSSHARQRSGLFEQRRLDLVLSGRVMHRRGVLSARCSATRASDNPRPCQAKLGRFLLPLFSPGGARVQLFGPSQVYSHRWVARHFCQSGPTCHSAPRVPARLIFVGPDRSPTAKPACSIVGLSRWRGV